MELEKGKRTYIGCARVSTIKQMRTGQSVTCQIEQIKKYAHETNGELVNIVKVQASGKKQLLSNHKKKLSFGGRRLCGWIKYRVGNSSKPWVELRLNEFVKLTGISIRTCRRQLEQCSSLA